MFNISIYLDKFKNLGLEDSFLKNKIITSLKNIKIKINEKQIKINNGIVYLKVDSVVRNEIFIKKEIVINDLKLKGLFVKNLF